MLDPGLNNLKLKEGCDWTLDFGCFVKKDGYFEASLLVEELVVVWLYQNFVMMETLWLMMGQVEAYHVDLTD